MTLASDPGTVWGAILAVAVGTYALRLSLLYLFGRVDAVPPAVETTLRYVPAAVLAALAVPAVVTLRPTAGATVLDPHVLAGVVGFAVAWYTEDVLPTLVAGMGTLWLARFVVG